MITAITSSILATASTFLSIPVQGTQLLVLPVPVSTASNNQDKPIIITNDHRINTQKGLGGGIRACIAVTALIIIFASVILVGYLWYRCAQQNRNTRQNSRNLREEMGPANHDNAYTENQPIISHGNDSTDQNTVEGTTRHSLKLDTLYESGVFKSMRKLGNKIYKGVRPGHGTRPAQGNKNNGRGTSPVPKGVSPKSAEQPQDGEQPNPYQGSQQNQQHNGHQNPQQPNPIAQGTEEQREKFPGHDGIQQKRRTSEHTPIYEDDPDTLSSHKNEQLCPSTTPQDTKEQQEPTKGPYNIPIAQGEGDNYCSQKTNQHSSATPQSPRVGQEEQSTSRDVYDTKKSPPHHSSAPQDTSNENYNDPIDNTLGDSRQPFHKPQNHKTNPKSAINYYNIHDKNQNHEIDRRAELTEKHTTENPHAPLNDKTTQINPFGDSMAYADTPTALNMTNRLLNESVTYDNPSRPHSMINPFHDIPLHEQPKDDESMIRLFKGVDGRLTDHVLNFYIALGNETYEDIARFEGFEMRISRFEKLIKLQDSRMFVLRAIISNMILKEVEKEAPAIRESEQSTGNSEFRNLIHRGVTEYVYNKTELFAMELQSKARLQSMREVVETAFDFVFTMTNQPTKFGFIWLDSKSEGMGSLEYGVNPETMEVAYEVPKSKHEAKTDPPKVRGVVFPGLFKSSPKGARSLLTKVQVLFY